jgi:hypothetical protein
VLIPEVEAEGLEALREEVRIKAGCGRSQHSGISLFRT